MKVIKYIIIIFFLFFINCANNNLLEQFSSKFILTSQLKIQNINVSSNVSTPTNFLSYLYRLEGLSEINDTDSIILINRDRDISISDIVSIPFLNETPVIIEEKKIKYIEKEIKYLKFYYGIMGVSLYTSDFLNSNEISVKEYFYSALNNFRLSDLNVSSNNQLALNRKINKILFLDSAKQPEEVLQEFPIQYTNQNFTYSGADINGNYILIPVDSFYIENNNIFYIDLVYDITNIFEWDDVSSQLGVFDAKSYDVINWKIKIPDHLIKIGEF